MHLAELSGGDSKHHGIIYQSNLATTAYQVLASDPFFSAFFHHSVNHTSWWYFYCFILCLVKYSAILLQLMEQKVAKGP